MAEAAPPAHSFRRSRQLFLRALGAIYAVAFLSWDAQVEGLVGERGILPAADLLARVQASLGASAAHLQVPTLLWLDASDRALHLVARGGAVAGLLVTAGLAPLPLLGACFALYLSLVTTGGVFMNFQWDSLLLEAGLLAILYAPPVLRLARAAEPPRATRLLLAFLLFRLMFLSGVVKLTWGDATWRDLSALEYHFFTQPIPSLTSWWAQQLGPAAHAAMTAIMFAIEIALPFLFFAPRRLRLFACASQIALQLGILATGNYGFFNWLTIALCLPLLDDAALDRLTPAALRRPPPVEERARPSRPARLALTACALALFVLEARQLALGVAPRRREEIAARDGLAGLADRALEQIDAVHGALAPLRAINAYGLFRSMTTTRPEITVEGSSDGQVWRPYRFKWKPGPVERAPGFVAPHMPRLDWQMWFAALAGDCQHARFYLLFARRLLENAPAVTALLDENPFPDAPPRLLRSTLLQYRFTTRAERETSGAYWVRENDRPFCPTLTLDGDQLRAEP